MKPHRKPNEVELFGIGSYSAREAARLLRTSPRKVLRWMKGYDYLRDGKNRHVDALWAAQWPIEDDVLELGFRDLIELRFVKAFTDAGLGLLAVRNCLEYARECVGSDHPFSTRRFQTDGKTIFLESFRHSEEARLLDLKRRQFVFREVIERTFKDLDIEDDAVARWRPFDGRKSIVIDPGRSFGQPIANDSGVPTIALAQAVEAEGSMDRVARLFETAPSVVRDAVRFENALKAA